MQVSATMLNLQRILLTRRSLQSSCSWPLSRALKTLRPALSISSTALVISMEASTRQPKHDDSEADDVMPCNIEHHLSKEASARTLSSLSKFIFSFSGIPGMVGLHGGLPPPSIFPFKAMKVQLEDGTWLDMSAKDKVCCLPCIAHRCIHA